MLTEIPKGNLWNLQNRPDLGATGLGVQPGYGLGSVDPRLLALKIYRDNQGNPWSFSGEGFSGGGFQPAPIAGLLPYWRGRNTSPGFTAPAGYQGDLGNAYNLYNRSGMEIAGFGDIGISPDMSSSSQTTSDFAGSSPNMQVYMEALRGFADGKGLHSDSRIGSTNLPLGMVWYFQDSHGNVYGLSGWPEEQGTIRLLQQGAGERPYGYGYSG